MSALWSSGCSLKGREPTMCGRFARYVALASSFNSLTKIGAKPACSNPRDKPPQPAKRSMRVRGESEGVWLSTTSHAHSEVAEPFNIADLTSTESRLAQKENKVQEYFRSVLDG